MDRGDRSQGRETPVQLARRSAGTQPLTTNSQRDIRRVPRRGHDASPEPSSFAFSALGLRGLGFAGWRRWKRKWVGSATSQDDKNPVSRVGWRGISLICPRNSYVCETHRKTTLVGQSYPSISRPADHEHFRLDGTSCPTCSNSSLGGGRYCERLSFAASRNLLGSHRPNAVSSRLMLRA